MQPAIKLRNGFLSWIRRRWVAPIRMPGAQRLHTVHGLSEARSIVRARLEIRIFARLASEAVSSATFEVILCIRYPMRFTRPGPPEWSLFSVHTA